MGETWASFGGVGWRKGRRVQRYDRLITIAMVLATGSTQNLSLDQRIWVSSSVGSPIANFLNSK
jgi:hypothetical protein